MFRCHQRPLCMRASETVPDQPSGAPYHYHPSSTEFTQNFNLPLSTQAHQQLTILQGVLSDKQIVAGLDQWKYSWGNSIFSTSRAYKILAAGDIAHPVFHWIWKSKCQMKHKVFFWLLLKDRLSTRDLLRRKDMNLDSYTCDLCTLQRPETSAHLFLHCNFAKACWNCSWGFIHIH
jgi:hypothetical protein